MKNKKTIFSIVIILFWFSLYAYVPQLTNYAKELGASYKLIGMIGSAYGLSQTILRIPLGILSDKLRRRKIFVLFGVAVAITSSSIMFFLPSPYSLLIARFIAGIASATWVNFTVLFISYYSKEESNKAVGTVNANAKLGQLLAMFIGGFIAGEFGVEAVFLVSVIIGFISLLVGLLIEEKNVIIKTEKDNKTLGISTILKDKNIVHTSILAAIVQIIAYSTSFGFTPIIASGLGASNFELGLLTTFFNFPQVLFSVLAGTFIAKKMGEKNALLLGFSLITAVCFLTPFVPKLSFLYILQLVSGTGNAITFALLMSIVIRGVDDDLKTTTMGFYQAVFGVGLTIGPILLGGIGDIFGLTTGYIVVGIFGVIAIYSILKMKYIIYTPRM